MAAARERFAARIGSMVASMSKAGPVTAYGWWLICEEFLDHLGAHSTGTPDLDTPEAKAALGNAAEAAGRERVSAARAGDRLRDRGPAGPGVRPGETPGRGRRAGRRAGRGAAAGPARRPAPGERGAVRGVHEGGAHAGGREADGPARALDRLEIPGAPVPGPCRTVRRRHGRAGGESAPGLPVGGRVVPHRARRARHRRRGDDRRPNARLLRAPRGGRRHLAHRRELRADHRGPRGPGPGRPGRLRRPAAGRLRVRLLPQSPARPLARRRPGTRHRPGAARLRAGRDLGLPPAARRPALAAGRRRPGELRAGPAPSRTGS